MFSTDISKMWQRAWQGVLVPTRLLLVFCTLLCCGVVLVFFQSLMRLVDGWLSLALGWFPYFFVLGLVVAVEAMLIRLYVRKNPCSLWAVIADAWESIVKLVLSAMPLAIAFILLWATYGLLALVGYLPYLGKILTTLFYFVPFLLQLFTLGLAVMAFYLIFIVAPTITLQTNQWMACCYRRLSQHLMMDLGYVLLAALPLFLVVKGLLFSYHLTAAVLGDGWWIEFMTALSAIVPFVACLTPVALFFINFAAEAHLAWIQVDKTAQEQLRQDC